MEIEFESTKNLGGEIFLISFKKPPGLSFVAGDYLELSLPKIGTNNKRWLSILSSPNSSKLEFITRIPNSKPSDFKRRFLELCQGDKAFVSPAIGTFNLPRKMSRPLLFFAAGLGISPIVSMTRWLNESSLSPEGRIIYLARKDEYFFADEVSKSFKTVKISPNEIRDLGALKTLEKFSTSLEDSDLFLSGPEDLIKSIYEQVSTKMPINQIHLDYFEGYKTI